MVKALRGLILLALVGASLGAAAWYLTGRRRKPESFAPPAAPPSYTAPIGSYVARAAPVASAPVEPGTAADGSLPVAEALAASPEPAESAPPSYITTYPTPEVRSFFVEMETPAPVAPAAETPAPAEPMMAPAPEEIEPDPQPESSAPPVDEPDGSPPSYVTIYPTPAVTSFFVEQDPPAAGEAASAGAPSVIITTFAVPDTAVIALVAPATAVEPAPAAAPGAPEAAPDPVAETPEVAPAPASALEEGANHLLDAFTRYAESTDDIATAEEPVAAEWDPVVETASEPAPAPTPSRPDVATARTADAHLDEGNVYFNVGQYILAIECYSSAIDLQPDLIAAYYNRANARTRLGHYGQALADYDRALELEPNDADALNNRGMLHLYRSDYASAIRDFEVALSIDPGDTTIVVNRGLAYLHSGNGAAALVDFEAAAAADPGDAAAYYGCAQATATLGDRDVALRHLTRAFELDPAYVREAAADPKLASLQGDPEFLKLLRDTGSRGN